MGAFLQLKSRLIDLLSHVAISLSTILFFPYFWFLSYLFYVTVRSSYFRKFILELNKYIYLFLICLNILIIDVLRDFHSRTRAVDRGRNIYSFGRIVGRIWQCIPQNSPGFDPAKQVRPVVQLRLFGSSPLQPPSSTAFRQNLDGSQKRRETLFSSCATKNGCSIAPASRYDRFANGNNSKSRDARLNPSESYSAVYLLLICIIWLS